MRNSGAAAAMRLLQAIQAQVNVVVQLAPNCEADFRMALHHGGLTRVEEALAEIDAEVRRERRGGRQSFSFLCVLVRLGILHVLTHSNFLLIARAE